MGWLLAILVFAQLMLWFIIIQQHLALRQGFADLTYDLHQVRRTLFRMQKRLLQIAVCLGALPKDEATHAILEFGEPEEQPPTRDEE